MPFCSFTLPTYRTTGPSIPRRMRCARPAARSGLNCSTFTPLYWTVVCCVQVPVHDRTLQAILGARQQAIEGPKQPPVRLVAPAAPTRPAKEVVVVEQHGRAAQRLRDHETFRLAVEIDDVGSGTAAAARDPSDILRVRTASARSNGRTAPRLLPPHAPSAGPTENAVTSWPRRACTLESSRMRRWIAPPNGESIG